MSQGELFPGYVSKEQGAKAQEKLDRDKARQTKQDHLIRADVMSWVTPAGVQLSVIADLCKRNGVLPGTRINLLHLLWEAGFEMKLQQQGSWMLGNVAGWVIYPPKEEKDAEQVP